MGIGGTHDAGFQQSVVAIHTHECFHDEGGEAQVLLGRLARCMQQHAIVGAERPVVVLTATVDACEGLFMQQHTEAMLAGYTLHDRHQQHVVVNSQVGVLEDGCQLELVGCHLVVTGLARDAQLQCTDFQFAHEGSHTLGDRAKVVVVHLLVLGTVVTHQGAAC